MKLLWMRCGLSITIGVLLILVSVSASVTYLPIPGDRKQDAIPERQYPVTEVGPIDEVDLVSMDTFQDTDCGRLKSFSNSEEFKEHMEVTSQELDEKLGQTRWYWPGPMVTGVTAGATTATSNTDAATTTSTGSFDFSNTNIQVEGVDEPDIVKTDGEYLYVKSGHEIVILKAYPGEDARVLSRIKTTNGAREMFITDSRLIFFEPTYNHETSVQVYDISSPSTPEPLQNITFDSTYFDSRLIGDYVYMVFNGELWYYYYNQVTRQRERSFKLPIIVSNGETTTIDASGICYFDNPALDYSLTIVASLSLQDGTLRYKTYLTDDTNTMYVSIENIYIASWDYSILWGGWNDEWERSSLIHRISISDGEIRYSGNGTVSGALLNQFAMDEREEYFRVATSEGYEQTNVYVLDGELEIIGSLEGLAPGEKMYSARFLGERCYLVTFKKVDPFFVIDLSDPESPKVLGKLKIPGYSDYLHPYDENHIIGLGKDTYDMGRFAWYQGVKLSMFDVTDLENPREISQYVIGDRGTHSPALGDHKAFMFSKSKNLLIIPISLYEIDESKHPLGAPPETHGEFVWQGAYVFSLSWNLHFKLRGRITHLEADDKQYDCGYSYYWFWDLSNRKPKCISRSLYIGNEIYTISEGMVKINSMGSLSEIKAIEL
jgi:uncharacterized secreted protein with C-terminal beta-propeller domain